MCVEGNWVKGHLNSAIPLAKLAEGSISQASDKACIKPTLSLGGQQSQLTLSEDLRVMYNLRNCVSPDKAQKATLVPNFIARTLGVVLGLQQGLAIPDNLLMSFQIQFVPSLHVPSQCYVFSWSWTIIPCFQVVLFHSMIFLNSSDKKTKWAGALLAVSFFAKKKKIQQQKNVVKYSGSIDRICIPRELGSVACSWFLWKCNALNCFLTAL